VLKFLGDRLKSVPTHAYASGESVIAAGTTTGKLFFLQAGELNVVRDGVAITRIREQGAVFGEMSLLLGGPHTADVVATAPSVCHVVDAARELLLASPEMTAYVAAVLAHRLDAVTRYLVDLKSQLADAGGHLGMIDEVLETVMTRHPRALRVKPA
jgi:CRP/FNR family transcriptional regulator, cyclic AMP receptor protein